MKGESQGKHHLPLPLAQPRKQKPELQVERDRTGAGLWERKQTERDKEKGMVGVHRTQRPQLASKSHQEPTEVLGEEALSPPP